MAELTRIQNGEKLAYYQDTYGDGRYRVLKHLASGGQGYVLLARDTWSDSLVAIKGFFWNSESELAVGKAAATQRSRIQDVTTAVRVLSEMGSISQCVPTFVDTLTLPSPARRALDCLVSSSVRNANALNLEVLVVVRFIGDEHRLKSETLGEYIKRTGNMGSQRQYELIAMTTQLACALESIQRVIHSAEGSYFWAHCDIKPNNVLMSGPGEPLLFIDLDAAARVPVGPKAKPVPWSMGTPGYHPSSETIEPLSQKSDVFSLAATVYEMATGRSANRLVSGGRVVRRRLVEHLSQVGVHPVVTRVVADCLVDNPERRLGVRQVIHDLRMIEETLRRTDALHELVAP
jgi:serine/threonine protein kinase